MSYSIKLDFRLVLKLWFILYLVFFQNQAIATEYDIFQVETKIEEIIQKSINNHIGPDKYVVIVKIDPKEFEKTFTDQTNQEVNLPYTSLKINPKKLDEEFFINLKDYMFKLPLKIDLLFDESVTAEKQKIIVDKLKQTLFINDQTRTIQSSTAKLSSVEKSREEAQGLIETSNLAVERTKIELERQKSEASKVEYDLKKELEDSKKTFQTKLDDAIKDKAKTTIDWVRDFQLAILATILGLCTIIFGIMGSSAFRNASTIISEAMVKVGSNIASSSAPSFDLGGESPARQQAGSGQNSEISVTSASSPFDSKMENFLTLVEEKIEVLSNEGNFDFYRNFIDLAEENISQAAAILLAVKSEYAKKLVSNLSPEVIEKITRFLAEPDGLSSAKKARKAALEQFYASIAMDEFLESPLIKVKNIGWLTKLSTDELKNLALELDKEERSQFLACFSPTRLSLLIEKTVDTVEKDKLIDCIVDIDTVTVTEIESMFVKIEQMYSQKIKADSERVRKLVDGPHYVAKVISSLRIKDDRTKLVSKLSRRTELMEAIRNYYIPFESIAKLSTRTIEEIFAKRPAQQVALALFSTSDDVKDSIMTAVPELLRESIKEELETLQADRQASKKYEMQSNKVQQEICRYLLLLNKDGLLEYKEERTA